jgi:heptosyltransferase-2
MRFLVIRLSSMGDVILTTPFLRALRRRFPGAEIHFLTKTAYAGLVETHPAVDAVLTFDSAGSRALSETGARLRANRYDVVFDLHKNLRSVPLARMARPSRVYRINKATFRRWLLIGLKVDLLEKRGDAPAVYVETGKGLGLLDDGDPPDVHPDAEAVARADETSAGMQKPLWGLIPSASSWNKRWPYFAELGRGLVGERGGTCLLFGGPGDTELCASIGGRIGPAAVSLAGVPTPLEMAALLRRCALAVGNDTGPMHLAVAVGTPTVAFFGPTTRRLGYYPRGDGVRILEREMDCRPCTKNGLEYCPRRRDLACLRDISVEDVLDSCRGFLEVAK